MTESKERYMMARNVTLLGALVNLFLAVIKVLFGWLGRSHALFADGIHSFSDLLTDALVLMGSHYGSKKADWDHPYGHERFETAATLLLALLLIIAGLAIAWNSVEHLFTGAPAIPKSYVLIIAIISIVANEALYHVTLYYSKKITSNLLVANAWHHRSDALSSVVVLIGVSGALLGYQYLDTIAAILVGIMIIHMGWGLGWSSVMELVDTGVPAETLTQIKNLIMSVPGVKELHQLRTRCMANKILVDAHIMVEPYVSVSEGHYIASKVSENLYQSDLKINDVTIHVDPENDEEAPLSRHLPPREQILAELISHWLNCPAVDYVYNIKLHYLKGKIEVEVHLPLFVLSETDDVAALIKAYQTKGQELYYIRSVDVQFG